MAIVDIHCHNFNADDLPVRGFVQKVAFHDLAATEDLARLVDLVVQGAAIGFEAENRKLDTLLSRALSPEAGIVAVEAVAADLDREVEATLAELDAREPDLVRRVGVVMEGGAPPVPGEVVPEGLFDWVSGARRAVRWARIFGKERLDVTVALVANFHGEVDLFTPLLVDLEAGLSDTPATTVRQQVVLQEKISRLSMLGLLPGDHSAHIHPFVGFDPRREVVARRAGHIEKPLEMLRLSVERYGVIGVKLYPPMGFRPMGNAGRSTPGDGAAIDAVLRDLYAWCEANGVPITTHCNPSNYAAEAFKDFSSPDLWKLVLQEFPDLHLNLGHFGGASDKATPQTGWPRKVAKLMARFDHLYADVGNHRIDDPRVRETYLALLGEIFATGPVVAERIMFGSDWYMVAMHSKHDRFLESYRKSYRGAFGAKRTAAFLGGNALSFLGFDDPTAQNTLRLRHRYETHAPGSIPDWLAGP